MPHDTIVRTGFGFDGKVSRSLFEGHPPIEMAGMSAIEGAPRAWSPPHLFIAAVESCIFLTIAAVAAKMRIEIRGYSSSAEGVLSSADGKRKEFSEIVVRPRFEFANPADASRIPDLARIAEEYCYVSRSLKSRIRILPE
jgi:organic hydroperoxide reductase OsmC/OhrA